MSNDTKKLAIASAAVVVILGVVFYFMFGSGESARGIVIEAKPEDLTRQRMSLAVERARAAIGPGGAPNAMSELPPAGIKPDKSVKTTPDQDAWGHELSIQTKRAGNQATVVISSTGPDGQKDNDDDYVVRVQYLIYESGVADVSDVKWVKGAG